MNFKIVYFTLATFGFSILVTLAEAGNLDDRQFKEPPAQEEKHYPPMILDHGGPDGGGYYFIDSDDDAMNAPEFEWIDISGIGTPITLGDDSISDTLELGFSFYFYGSSYNGLRVCSNGWASFTTASRAHINTAIPNVGDPNNLLALFWDDLNPDTGGTVYYYQDVVNNRFIVSYDGVPFYVPGEGTGSVYMQLILDPADTSIVFQYLSLDGGTHGLTSGTVGIENAAGSIGTQYLFNQDGIHDQLAVYFGFHEPIFGQHNVAPTAFVEPPPIGQVGNPIAPIVTYSNLGSQPETFGVRLIIRLNDEEQYNQIATVYDLPSDSSIDVTFPSYTPGQEGVYALAAISELGNDEFLANDTLECSYHAFAQIAYYDFEGQAIFEADTIWEWGAPTSGPGGAHSGANVWATVLAGNYPNGGMGRLTTPPFGIGSSAVLGFWHWYDAEANYDGCNVKISTDGGSIWELLHPDNGYDDAAHSSNPLYPDSIFTGHSAGHFWQVETFDLSAYGGESALFRFDFGSDTTIAYPGWYIDDFTLLGGGGVAPGWIAGTVRDYSSGSPLTGAVVTAGAVSDVTGPDGVYSLELYPGSYSVTATAQYHNSSTAPNAVVEGDTTTQDFSLTAPMLEMDASPIDVQMRPSEIDTLYRTVSNTGDGDLEFDISISYGGRVSAAKPSFTEHPVTGVADANAAQEKQNIPHDGAAISHHADSDNQPPVALDFGDEVAYYNMHLATGDYQLFGPAFVDGFFWLSGGNSGSDPNYIYKVNRDGVLVSQYDEGTTSWGWLDLTTDGTYIYGTDFNTDVISQFDPATGQIVGTISNPTASGLGIAYDPVTDNFWGINWFGSPIIEFTRDGQVVGSHPQAPLTSGFGIAWDDVSPDGPWLWVFAQETGAELTIAQFDPVNHVMTGVQFQAINHDGADIAGGLEFTTEWDPAFGLLVALGQAATTDWVGLYEIAEAFNWLRVDPRSGTVPPGGNQNLAITIDLTGITAETTLTATIDVSSNSPVNPSIPVTVSVVTGIEVDGSYLPEQFALNQNYPNPFNAVTNIVFGLPKPSNVDLSVYNSLGQKVATLVSGPMPAGYHKATWNASDFASGVYFYKLTASETTMVKQMTLLK